MIGPSPKVVALVVIAVPVLTVPPEADFSRVWYPVGVADADRRRDRATTTDTVSLVPMPAATGSPTATSKMSLVSGSTQ